MAIAAGADAKALQCESSGLIGHGNGVVHWRYDPLLEDPHWPSAADRDKFQATLAVLIDKAEAEADARAVAALGRASKGLACEPPCALSLSPSHGAPGTIKSDGSATSISPWKLAYACKKPPEPPLQPGGGVQPPQPQPGQHQGPGQGGAVKTKQNGFSSFLSHFSVGVGVESGSGSPNGGQTQHAGPSTPTPQSQPQPQNGLPPRGSGQ